MKRFGYKLLVWTLSCLLALAIPGVAIADENNEALNSADTIAGAVGRSAELTYTGPALSEAQAAIVVDGQGNIIYGLNIDAEFNMASITKIMTAVVALENGFDLDSQITCVGCTLDENAQLAGFKAGEVVSARDLWNAMLVFSANDAAYEIATSVAGSEEAFLELMNSKAQELNMLNTVYKNCHGLDADGHHSTVSDLAILARYAMTTYPEISNAVKMESVVVPIDGYQVTLESTDDLLSSYAGAMGIKTGMGNNTACFLGAARRDGLTLYSCVLGCQTDEGRFVDTATLFDAAFTSYTNLTFASPTKVDATNSYAYHFGWSVQTRGGGVVRGYAKAGGSSITRTNLTPSTYGQLLDTNQQVCVSQWTQANRVVATAVLSTDSEFVPSRIGFGLVDSLLSNTIPKVDANILSQASEYLHK